MPAMECIAEYNRKVTNPWMRPWAGWAPTLAVASTSGGAPASATASPWWFSTPATDWQIMLPYGPNRDWIRNLSAAGRARVQRYGKTFPVTNPPYRG